MEEKFDKMLEAMKAAAENLPDVLTMDQFKTAIKSVKDSEFALKNMDRTLAIPDTLTGLNHLNQFIGGEKLPYDESEKENILKNIDRLTYGKRDIVAELNSIVKNKVALELGSQKELKLDEIIANILDDLTLSAQRLAK